MHYFTDQRLEGGHGQGPSRTRRCKDGSAQLPPRTILLISVSRADAVREPRNPQMHRRERLAATPHGPTDQRFEA
jgi:hypothetical protein